MNRIQPDKNQLFLYTPRDFVVFGAKKKACGTEEEKRPGNTVRYCAVRGPDLICKQADGFGRGMPRRDEPTRPLLLGPWRQQTAAMCRAHEPELRDIVAQFRAMGPESTSAYVGIHKDFWEPFGYLRFLFVNVVSWDANVSREVRIRNKEFAEQSLRSIEELQAILHCIDTIEAEQALPAEGRDLHRATLLVDVRRKLIDWERQKGSWTTPGLRALAELWSALLQFQDGAGAELLIDVQREAAEGPAQRMGRDPLRLQQDIYRRLQDSFGLITFPP